MHLVVSALFRVFNSEATVDGTPALWWALQLGMFQEEPCCWCLQAQVMVVDLHPHKCASYNCRTTEEVPGQEWQWHEGTQPLFFWYCRHGCWWWIVYRQKQYVLDHQSSLGPNFKSTIWNGFGDLAKSQQYRALTAGLAAVAPRPLAHLGFSSGSFLGLLGPIGPVVGAFVCVCELEHHFRYPPLMAWGFRAVWGPRKML